MERGSNFMEEFYLISHSKVFRIFILLLLISGNAFAQTEKFQFTGKPAYDFEQISKIPFEKNNIFSLNQPSERKSVFLAGALSAILPGAGEFYSEEYLKSAIFFGIEVAAITVGLIYDKKGDDQTNYFESFAGQHWDVIKYASWTLQHAKDINPSVDPSSFHLFDSNGKVIWSELNRLENAVGQSTNYYSHRLAPHGDQQYYEMIGKYPQFNPGWDDFDVNKPYHYGDPLTDRFLYYSGERAKANDFYSIASKAVMVVVTNHVLSLFDAIWSASSFNKRVQLNVSLQKEQVGFRTDYSTVLNFRYNF